MENEPNYDPTSDEDFQEENEPRKQVVVKFSGGNELLYRANAETYVEQSRLGPWDNLKEEFPGISLHKMYPASGLEELGSLVDQATKIDPTYQPPDFSAYFVIDCPPGIDPHAVAKAIESWPTVEKAYYDPPGEEPIVDSSDDPRFSGQGYLKPAPEGIDAIFVWPKPDGSGFAGGDGSAQNIIDLEQGWTLNHEDLTAHGATLLHGTIRNLSRAHGTSVLGEICAVDNTVGCVGIAPNIASVNVVSYFSSSRVNALLAAIARLSFGDVLLLEAQLDVLGFPKMPIEVLDPEFHMIRLATALGIVVIEAAGNGGHNLNTFTNSAGQQILNRGSADFRDSGAIMVGASTSTVPHRRMGFSNFGSRIDCYAWGENVNTASSNSSGSTTLYRDNFSGTSSASPIIAGAALLVQGIAQANLGHRFGPFQLQVILSDPTNGTASNNPVSDLIGVMPDLKTIAQKLNTLDTVEKVQIILRRTSGNRFVSTKIIHPIDARLRRPSTPSDVFIRSSRDGFLRAKLGPEYFSHEAEIDINE